MDNIAKLLREFHRASKVSVFTFNQSLTPLKAFKLPVTPEFPTKYLKIFKNLNQPVSLFNTGGEECFSVIKLDDAKKTTYIILWVNTATLEITGYYEDRFPSIGLQRLTAYTRLLYFSLFQSFPVISEPTEISDIAFTSDKKHDSSIQLRRQEKIFHNSYAKEQKMLEALEKGNQVQFDKCFTDFIQSGSYGQMSLESDLRNKKNIAIAATTLMTRSAIRGGVHPEAAFALSDQCVQRIEQQSDVISVSDLVQEIGTLFINRIKSSKKYSNDAVVYMIQDYIFKNLDKKISLDEIAKTVGYSKNYLCRIFKKDVGITIFEYINIQRIHEAKSQIIFSNQSIFEIANNLGFSDQSYLTKLFLKYEHTTPSQFRSKYFVS
ncbi:transcriptional regulator, AraC family [Agrilactobacillus composti DSM 18527 = JCM 14202]|uniref:Transcriptional regulator, AraC family n=1 Tax=Agrilactobacillus composti DSM 18527 = JCM 14202 TaxID=1423734 RepID=X0PUD6_9LACO|nr:AraC family transcriptional regulator [Agrilactobacillus composti]KRM36121.1 transcriptional regulator, AraC family [Agrilactobacillus composti DSM 18527 = JCM 14202]GAF41712.1 transcriptional regulator, AraC family [Agrilactobacillus composti DSM 18527 = JCM 14202]